MGVYSEYLDRNISFQELTAERKRMLQRISELRQRDVLSYAADAMKAQLGAPVALSYDDLLPITDQVANWEGMRSTSFSKRREALVKLLKTL